MRSEHGIAVEGLGKGLVAWMSTRAGGVSQPPFDSLNLGRSVGDEPSAVAENRARVAALLGAEPMFLHQVHGTRCVPLSEEAGGQQADAAVSTRSDLAIAIQVADCLPLLFSAVDDRGRALAVAGAHAGWRGLAAGVIENTVTQLREAAPACSLRAWLGPCIGPTAFEVGADVQQVFEGDEDCFRYAPRPDGDPRWLADLQSLALRRLKGLQVDEVQRLKACTFSEPSRFFSFRRDGARSGRLAAFIRLLP
jgi:YfiH family protein